MSENERLCGSWIANASAWCDAVRGRKIESRRLVTDAAIVDAVRDQRPARVLDLGCGEGWLTRALSGLGLTVTGVDASEPLIAAARQAGGAEFVVATYEQLATRLPWEHATFDAIVANFSLLSDRDGDVLAALRPAMRDGGKLIVQTVHPPFACGSEGYADGWCRETFATLPGQWAEAMPWYFRTLGSWLALFSGAGYVLDEVREPMHPDLGVPASVIFICSRR